MNSRHNALHLVVWLALAGGFAEAQERFDHLVRNDFFAGFAGDQAALERGMKVCEEILSTEPKHAEALAWHGSGLLFAAGKAFEKGDFAKGGELWTRSMKEMDDAVQLKPDSVAILAPRGAVLLTASRGMPNAAQAQPLIQKGLADYEKIYAIQKDHFEQLSGHARGELLYGLGEGYHRLGDETRARDYFEKLLAIGKISQHEADARQWLETKTVPQRLFSCNGCHTK